MIGAAVARRQHISPGDSVTIPVRDGFVSLPVQGIWADGNVVGNVVQMPLAKLEELFGPLPGRRPAADAGARGVQRRARRQHHGCGLRPALRAEPAEVVAERISAGCRPSWPRSGHSSGV